MARKKDPSKFSPSHKRLLEVIERQLGRPPTKTEVAGIFNVSPQMIGNWEDRGVSKDGAILAETLFGCSVSWVLEGVGRATSPQPMGGQAAEPPPIYLSGKVVPMPALSPMAVITELGRMLQKLDSEEHRRAVAGTLASFANSGGNPLFHKMLLAAFEPQDPPQLQSAQQS